MSSLQWMLVWAIGGAEVGLFYPWIVLQFKKDMPGTYLGVSLASDGWRVVRLVVFSLIISAVVVLLGFVAFLGSPENQAKMVATGWLAYVSAFSFGFAAASVFEEPLRKN